MQSVQTFSLPSFLFVFGWGDLAGRKGEEVSWQQLFLTYSTSTSMYVQSSWCPFTTCSEHAHRIDQRSCKSNQIKCLWQTMMCLSSEWRIDVRLASYVCCLLDEAFSLCCFVPDPSSRWRCSHPWWEGHRGTETFPWPLGGLLQTAAGEGGETVWGKDSGKGFFFFFMPAIYFEKNCLLKIKIGKVNHIKDR